MQDLLFWTIALSVKADESSVLTESEHLDGLEMNEGWGDQNILRYIGHSAEVIQRHANGGA